MPICIYLPPLKESVLFTGVQGFKSPLDNTPTSRDAGNFGFHGGVNLGGRMSWLPIHGLGFQAGYSVALSQFSGSAAGGAPTDSSHTQQFFTAGLFRRRPVGLQYGVVYDLVRDERQASMDFGQIRGMISGTNPYGHETGFMFTAHTDETTIGGDTFRAMDQYSLFYRFHGCNGGEFRVFAGGTDDGHGLLGGDLQAPLNDWWSLQTGFTYAIPGDGGADAPAPGSEANEEAWNVGITLIWHYGGRARKHHKSPWRPMFNVANNGSMIIDDRD